jgi:hypothetical protein
MQHLLKRALKLSTLLFLRTKFVCSAYLQPVREHFKKDSNAKDLLKRVKVCSFNSIFFFLNIFFLFTFYLQLYLRICRLALNNEIFWCLLLLPYKVPTLSSRAQACPQNIQVEPGQSKLVQARLVYTFAHELALSSWNASNQLESLAKFAWLKFSMCRDTHRNLICLFVCWWIYWCSMSLEEKYQIVRSVGVECILDGELRNLLANKPEPVCYDGFEPSGRMHIAQV